MIYYVTFSLSVTALTKYFIHTQSNNNFIHTTIPIGGDLVYRKFEVAVKNFNH